MRPARAADVRVTVDGRGVFANEIQTDTVVMLDPKTSSSRCSSCRRERRHSQGIVDAQGATVHGLAQRAAG